MKHLLGSLKSQGKAIVNCSSPSRALLIDKWAWLSIEIVEIQLITSAGAGIQLQAYRHRLETESKAQLHASAIVLCIYYLYWLINRLSWYSLLGKVLIEQRNLSVNRQGVISKQCKLCGKDL